MPMAMKVHSTSRAEAWPRASASLCRLRIGKSNDGGADVGDDEVDFEQRARGHAPVGTGTDDVVRVAQHRT